MYLIQLRRDKTVFTYFIDGINRIIEELKRINKFVQATLSLFVLGDKINIDSEVAKKL